MFARFLSRYNPDRISVVTIFLRMLTRILHRQTCWEEFFRPTKKKKQIEKIVEILLLYGVTSV